MSLRWVASLVAFAVIAAGCIGQERSTVTTPAPNPEDHFSAATNLTACNGSMATTSLPARQFSNAMPSRLRPLEQVPGFSTIFVESMRCDKIAVQGLDYGSGTLTRVLVVVTPPAGEPLPAGWFATYMAELVVEHDAFASALKNESIPFKSGGFRYSLTATPTFYQKVESRIELSTGPLYAHDYLITAGKVQRNENLRVYYGDGLLSSTFNTTTSQERSTGSGPGVLTTSSDSFVSRVSGAAATEAFGQLDYLSNHRWEFGGME